MGAYQIIKIEFFKKETRDFFEKEIDIPKRRLFQYKFANQYDCFYYMGWDSYGLGRDILGRLEKANKLENIIGFKSLDLSTESDWYDELKDYQNGKK